MKSTDLLFELCSIPTAPFVEDRVVQYIERFAAARPKLRLTRDQHGNLVLELPGKKQNLPRWIFTAHMDHPGLVSRQMLDANTLDADFRGWVLADLLPGVRVRFFDGDSEIRGTIIDAQPEAEGRGARAKRCRVKVNQSVSPNRPGMFDLPPAHIKQRKFHCRCCDDLAGAAAALAMLDALYRNPPPSTTAVLLTRAEEEGFIGALAASIKPELLRKSDRVVAIETSAMQPFAPQGAGPIIRVGDRTSIFNSSLTYFLTQQAESLKKRSKKFLYQRALMPGGTCEATVYDVYGFHAASICVALGNYHNMDRKQNRIAPEYIDVNDWQGMADLFIQIARQGHTYTGQLTSLQHRLEKRFNGLKRLLGGTINAATTPKRSPRSKTARPAPRGPRHRKTPAS